METQTTTPDTKPGKTKAAPRKLEKSPLKTLCSQLKVEPKAARRKLRKAGLSFHTPKERWVFTAAQMEKARAVLRPDLAEKDAKKAAKVEPTKQ